MPVPKKDEVRSTTGPAIEVEMVTIKDVSLSNEVKTFKKKDGTEGEIKLPLHIKLVDSMGKLVLDEPSKEVYVPNDWNSYFYTKDRWPRYTRDAAFVAIMAILQKREGKRVPEDFKVNSIITQEFEAAVVRKTDTPFIDWVKTLQANGVKVPTVEELGGRYTKEEQEKLDSVSDDTDPLEDLPF